MPRMLDDGTLQRRLDELIVAHKIPGASLAVLTEDRLAEAASGKINLNTGVETTTDTVFQIGSITKVWTATLVMMLVDDGLLDLDQPVVQYLPEFKVADPVVTSRVTLRHLLSHSSGIGGDHILDTGRGDDTLERYIDTCGEIGQEHELGATMSYCNTGYSVAGRIIEKVTGKVWDQVLRERLILPLGLTRTSTLPEEALLHRTAAGHVKPPGVDEAEVAPFWMLPRSAGPAGLINATAAEVIAFARLHLDAGRAPDGTQLLSPASVEQMQEPQVDVPDRFTLGDKWGLGWILFEWSGRRLFGHDGATVGQYAFLRVLPDPRVVICLLTNGGEASNAFKEICREVMQDIAGIEVPGPPEAGEQAVDVDLSLYEAEYRRFNVTVELTRSATGLTAKVTSSGPLAEMLPEEQRTSEMALVPVDSAVFLAKSETSPTPVPLVFFDFEGDRPKRLHFGARAMTRG